MRATLLPAIVGRRAATRVAGSAPIGRLRSLLFGVLIVILPPAVAGGCQLSCPAALIEGTLVQHDGELAVQYDDVLQLVRWSSAQVSVRDDDGVLVLLDWLGGVRARAGDFVSLGGGIYDDRWNVCGRFDVRPASPAGG